MRKDILVTGAVAAVVLAAIALFFFRREGAPPDRNEQSYTFQLTKLRDRLDHLEMRMDEVLDRLEGDAAPPTRAETAEASDRREEPAPDVNDEIARLLAQINNLFYRIRALEEDPINRGYTFVNSENADLRREGINALKRFAASDPAAREAIRRLLRDSSARVRMDAVDALGDLGDRDSAPLMTEMLNDPDPDVRREAVDSFADWGHKESSALITRMLSDGDANVRREAIVALGTLGASDASAQIAQLLSDSSPGVRQQAADSLGVLKARGATAGLVQALNDSNEEVRGEAIAALGEAGAVEALPYLRDIYERNPGRHMIRLVGAMRTLGDEGPFRQEVQRLSGVALSGSDERARAEAIQTLSWFARDESRDVFTKAIGDSSGWVRREAERALRSR